MEAEEGKVHKLCVFDIYFPSIFMLDADGILMQKEEHSCVGSTAAAAAAQQPSQ